MKKVFAILLAFFAAGMIFAQSSKFRFPPGMVMGDLEYYVSEAFVCAPSVEEANRMIDEYLSTYNIKRKITKRVKCCNHIDKNANSGVIMLYEIESSALD